MRLFWIQDYFTHENCTHELRERILRMSKKEFAVSSWLEIVKSMLLKKIYKMYMNFVTLKSNIGEIIMRLKEIDKFEEFSNNGSLTRSTIA